MVTARSVSTAGGGGGRRPWHDRSSGFGGGGGVGALANERRIGGGGVSALGDGALVSKLYVGGGGVGALVAKRRTTSSITVGRQASNVRRTTCSTICWVMAVGVFIVACMVRRGCSWVVAQLSLPESLLGQTGYGDKR